MTKTEALKLALKALEQIEEVMPFAVAKLVIPEIEKALAQDEWVELTRGDILSWELPDLCFSSKVELVWFIERKIREKNE